MGGQIERKSSLKKTQLKAGSSKCPAGKREGGPVGGKNQKEKKKKMKKKKEKGNRQWVLLGPSVPRDVNPQGGAVTAENKNVSACSRHSRCLDSGTPGKKTVRLRGRKKKRRPGGETGGGLNKNDPGGQLGRKDATIPDSLHVSVVHPEINKRNGTNAKGNRHQVSSQEKTIKTSRARHGHQTEGRKRLREKKENGPRQRAHRHRGAGD